MFSIVNATSGYGKTTIAHGVSLHVGDGDVVRLLGLDGPPVAAGTDLSSDGRTVGRVLYAARPRSGRAAIALGVIEDSAGQGALQLAGGGVARPASARSFLS